MLEVPVYNIDGKQIETLEVPEEAFGGQVNASLLKQAMVAYQANRRQGTSATRSRGMVRGSTRKLYRQKGTGYARRGQIRTNIMRGGGVAFAKTPKRFGKKLSRKMRKAALRTAILAKAIGQDLMVVDGLKLDAPRTRTLANLLKAMNVNRSCLLATGERDRNVYLSGRNHPDLTVRTAEELNAYDVATRQKLVLTREALDALAATEATQ
jgi:large subunit ribosomal protein L4